MFSTTQAIFRLDDRPQEWFDNPLWGNYTEFNISDTSIMISWRSPYNSGFHYATMIEKCERNEDTLYKTKLALYPSQMNHTFFYQNFLKDKYWTDCKIT